VSWTFVTNHSQVLRTIASNPDLRLRDIAEHVGITERAARRIVHDLEDGGYLTHTRVGRRNHYDVHEERSLRHPLALGVPVGELLGVLDQSDR
jgi:predicted transcriptional regulator